jgi:hypothetical protein
VILDYFVVFQVTCNNSDGTTTTPAGGDSPTVSVGSNSGSTVSNGGDGGDEGGDGDEQVVAAALDRGPLGCLSLNSAANCGASTEQQSSCSCASKLCSLHACQRIANAIQPVLDGAAGSARVRCVGAAAHVILFENANCQGSPAGYESQEGSNTCLDLGRDTYANVNCSNAPTNTDDTTTEAEAVEFTGCLDLHLSSSCSGTSAGRGCDCLNTAGKIILSLVSPPLQL